jgi:hypothetical protein
MRPTPEQLPAIKAIWHLLKDEFGFAIASFCDAIGPRIIQIVA